MCIRDRLKDLRDRIVAAALPGVVSVGPQYASSTVVVGITKEDPALLAELYRIGGDRVVAYATTQPTAASSRYYDLSPFHGAGQIVLTGTPTGSGTVCSSGFAWNGPTGCLLYTSPSPRDRTRPRMPSSA